MGENNLPDFAGDKRMRAWTIRAKREGWEGPKQSEYESNINGGDVGRCTSVRPRGCAVVSTCGGDLPFVRLCS